LFCGIGGKLPSMGTATGYEEIGVPGGQRARRPCNWNFINVYNASDMRKGRKKTT